MSLDSTRKSLEPAFVTLVRVVVGFVMVCYGLDKVENMAEWTNNLAELHVPMPGIAIYGAILSELGGGLGLMVGALTPAAAFGVISSMIVAIVTVHKVTHIIGKHNGIGFPLTLIIISLYFVVRGAGPYSLDALLGKVLKKDKPKSESAPAAPAKA